MRNLFLAVAVTAIACGSTAPQDDSGSPTDSGGSDTSVPKDASTDGAKDSASETGTPPGDDSGTKADSGGLCTGDGDCRLFSSYCEGTVLKGCQCYGLLASAPDPACDGSLVTCLKDPCQGKSPSCAGGTCGVK